MNKYIRVQCNCGNDVIVFGDSKTNVNCPKCGALIVESTGGHAKILCRRLEVLG